MYVRYKFNSTRDNDVKPMQVELKESMSSYIQPSAFNSLSPLECAEGLPIWFRISALSDKCFVIEAYRLCIPSRCQLREAAIHHGRSITEAGTHVQNSRTRKIPSFYIHWACYGTNITRHGRYLGNGELENGWDAYLSSQPDMVPYQSPVCLTVGGSVDKPYQPDSLTPMYLSAHSLSVGGLWYLIHDLHILPTPEYLVFDCKSGI
jgi:hypothetical protein